MRVVASLLCLVNAACGDDGGAPPSGGGNAGAAAAGAPASGGANPSGGSHQGAGGSAAAGNGSGGEVSVGGMGGAPADLEPPACPSGSVEIGTDTACTGHGPVAPAALTNAFVGSVRGEVVDVGDAIDEATCLPVRSCVSDGAPTLIFSDEPEYVAGDGVLYADIVQAGRYRLYIYHVNDGATRRRFTAVALNQEDMATNLTVERSAISPPSSSYLDVGRAVAANYYSAVGKPVQSILPGERVVVDTDLDGLVADPGELVHAIIELQINGPLKVSIVSVAENADAAAVTAGLSLIPNSGLHVRGTFPLADRLLLARHGSGLGSLRLGADLAFDPNLVGTSFVDGTGVTLAGNFGVTYDVRIIEPNVDLAVGINPRAGAWAGAMFGSAGLDASGGLVPLPDVGLSASDNDHVVAMGRYTTNISIGAKLLTGGGSSLPVHVVAVPLP